MSVKLTSAPRIFFADVCTCHDRVRHAQNRFHCVGQETGMRVTSFVMKDTVEEELQRRMQAGAPYVDCKMVQALFGLQ